MQNGQWVAFEVHTDQVHKHNKKSKNQKSKSLNNETTLLKEDNDLNINNKEPNYGLYFLIGLVLFGIWFFS